MQSLSVAERHPVLYLRAVTVAGILPGQHGRAFLVSNRINAYIGSVALRNISCYNIRFGNQLVIPVQPQMLARNADFDIVSCQIIGSISGSIPV